MVSMKKVSKKDLKYIDDITRGYIEYNEENIIHLLNKYGRQVPKSRCSNCMKSELRKLYLDSILDEEILMNDDLLELRNAYYGQYSDNLITKLELNTKCHKCNTDKILSQYHKLLLLPKLKIGTDIIVNGVRINEITINDKNISIVPSKYLLCEKSQ